MNADAEHRAGLPLLQEHGALPVHSGAWQATLSARKYKRLAVEALRNSLRLFKDAQTLFATASWPSAFQLPTKKASALTRRPGGNEVDPSGSTAVRSNCHRAMAAFLHGHCAQRA